MLFVAPLPLMGQVAAAPERAITGTVIDSLSGRALRGAQVFLPGRTTGIAAKPDGRFRLQNVAALDTVMYVRQIGYVPAAVVIPASPSAIEIDLGTVRLRPVATQLDRIAVEADEVRIFPHLTGFYQRKQAGAQGQFITREEIQRAGVRSPSQLLRGTVKVKMDCPDFDWQKQSGAARADPCTARSSRPRGTQMGAVELCEMCVVVDGDRSALKVDEIPLRSIAAIEVYSGPATTPVEFGQGGCGVVAIWTTGGR